MAWITASSSVRLEGGAKCNSTNQDLHNTKPIVYPYRKYGVAEQMVFEQIK